MAVVFFGGIVIGLVAGIIVATVYLTDERKDR